MDSFLIFDPERRFDESLCRDAAEVRATIVGADLKRFRVHRVTLGEIVRDVTDDFMPEEEADDDEYLERNPRWFSWQRLGR